MMFRIHLLIVCCLILLICSHSFRMNQFQNDQQQQQQEQHTSSPNNSNSIWKALQKLQDNLLQASQQTQQQQQQQRRQRPMRRAANKRRALLEFSLTSHYTDASITNEDDASTPSLHHHQHTSSGDSSWGHGPCVFFNQGKSSYWTFQYCWNQQVSQAHWIATSLQGEYRPELSHNLGNAIKDSEDTALVLLDEWKDWIHAESFERVEYFGNGDECLVVDESMSEQDATSSTPLARKTIVVKNPEPQCGAPNHVWQDWRIVAVTEPSPCHYIFYICGPRHDDTTSSTIEEEQVNAKSDATKSATKQQQHDQVSTNDDQYSAVLQAYLHEADVVDPTVPTNDRTVSWHAALPPLPPSRVQANRNLIFKMFTHAYDSYMYNAFPSPEIQPLTCTPGTFSLVKLPALTLIDALDTLLVMGNTTEFARSVERLRILSQPHNDTLFAVNQNVSVFETNIRVLGGLLSAHQLAEAFLESGHVRLSDVFEKNGKSVKIGAIESNKDKNAEVSMQEGKQDVKEEEPSAPDEEPRRTGKETADAAEIAGTRIQKPDVVPSSSSNDKPQNVEPECTVPSDAPTTTPTPSKDTSPGDLVCDLSQEQTKGNATKASSQVYWSYDGFLLDLAHDLGKRLLPAFDTKTGIPYGTVNLLHGIPTGETTIASLAGGGTLSLEMELLSRLTGDDSFGKAAKLASRALWTRRSQQHDLLGKHIDVHKGDWTETLSGIGSNSDSFYEYLIKHYALFPEDHDFWTMFVAVYNGVYNGTRTGEWYADVDMSLGTRHGASRRVFESLQAFYPGMQVLVGEVGPAARSLNSFFLVREFLGFLPERFNYGSWKVDGGPHGAGLHPLRPELLESCYFLHQATKSGLNETQSSGWLWAADFALHTLNELTDTPCGFATVKNLSPKTTGAVPPQDSDGIKLVNEMPSFFLSETLKYLYLAFDEDNILHRDDEREWIFTTEAHPIHHVPKRTSSDPNKPSSTDAAKKILDNKRHKVRDMLVARKSKTFNKGRNKRKVSSLPSTVGLMYEKWSDKTHLVTHMSGLRDCDSNTMARKLETKDKSIFQSYIPLEASDEMNQVYLSYGHAGMGDGSSLRKSCPNFHKSSLFWVRALNGGGMDYSEVYLSSLSDDLYSDQTPVARSAAGAIAVHGSGKFLGQFPESPSCSTSTETAKPKEEVVNPEATPMENGSKGTAQRFDMGGEEGEFEITAFPEGFMIERLKTGEVIVTTVLSVEDETTDTDNDGDDSTSTSTHNPFVMTYSLSRQQSSGASVEVPPKKWTGAGLRSFFGRNKHQSSIVPLERSVVVTNAANSAFRCEIQLFSTVKEENADEEEELLMVYPCAPALFGPSKLSRLAKLGEVEVEGEIRLPDPSDEVGCSEGDSYAPTSIQVVRRGQCTFQAKAVNQNLRSGAEAVIIINSVPEELFVMADGAGPDVELNSEERKRADEESPLTVMVTKNDGDIISAAIKQGMVTTARVQLVPHKGQVDTNGQVVGGVDWPIVRATSQSLIQVFSENGWGVHAINRPKQQEQASETPEQEQEWQLFLMKHALNQPPSATTDSTSS